jgi:hypothetical protein
MDSGERHGRVQIVRPSDLILVAEGPPLRPRGGITSCFHHPKIQTSPLAGMDTGTPPDQPYQPLATVQNLPLAESTIRCNRVA